MGQVDRGFTPLLPDQVHAASDRALLRAVKQRGIGRDHPPLISVQTRLVKSPPTKRIAGFDDFVETLSFAFPLNDRFLGAEVVAHNLEQNLPTAADFGG